MTKISDLVFFQNWKNLLILPKPPPGTGREKITMPAYKDEKTGKWYCKFYYTDWTGKKRQKLKRGFDRQRDAKDWERLFLEQFANAPDITFRTLCQKYKNFKENRVRPSTLQSQLNTIELHMLPYFDRKVIAEITPADIVDWQNHLLKKGFTAAYTRQINATLGMLFKFAVDYLGLARNPVKSKICKPAPKKVAFWTPEEYKCFSDAIRDNIELFTAFEILFYTGMRKGELLALTPGDIDFQEKKITINKTLAYVDGKYTIQPPKTPKSNRIIDIPQFLLDEIKDYMAKIYGMDPDDRLFSRSRVWLGEALTRVCKKINLRPIRVHDLRHSHASLLINLGANPLMIAERLGHDDVKMTMNTYSHLFQSHREEIIEKLEKIKF